MLFLNNGVFGATKNGNLILSIYENGDLTRKY